MGTAIELIIGKFGGVRPMARAIGRPSSPATVQYWKRQGYLPRTALPEVEAALIVQGVSPRRARVLVTTAVLGSSKSKPKQIKMADAIT